MSRQSDTLLVIPAYNEEKNIGVVISGIRKQCGTGIDILVVNDGSTDRTRERCAEQRVRVVSHPFNLGIGATVSTGCLFAVRSAYEYVVRMDGDGQHMPSFVPALLAPLRSGEADIVIGSRFLGGSAVRSSTMRLWGIGIITLLLYLLTGRRVTDPTSGFCAMNRTAFAFFSGHYVDDYPEPEMLLHHRKFRIMEVPVSIGRRLSGASTITPARSVYYMYRVVFSLLLSVIRREGK